MLRHGGRSGDGHRPGRSGWSGRRPHRRRGGGGGHGHRRQRRACGSGGISKARRCSRLLFGNGSPHEAFALRLHRPRLQRLEHRQPGRIAERRAAGIHLPGGDKRVVLEARPAVLQPYVLDGACSGTSRSRIGRRRKRRGRQEHRPRKGTKNAKKATDFYRHCSASFLAPRRRFFLLHIGRICDSIISAHADKPMRVVDAFRPHGAESVETFRLQGA